MELLYQNLDAHHRDSSFLNGRYKREIHFSRVKVTDWSFACQMKFPCQNPDAHHHYFQLEDLNVKFISLSQANFWVDFR